MKTTLARCGVVALPVALLVHLATVPGTAGKDVVGGTNGGAARVVPASQPTGAEMAELAALKRKLLGDWRGGPCVGDYTFNADGTFELRNFTPGQNILTGTWTLRWDALPPTLVVTCRTSDFRKRDPSRPEYEYLGKALELKLLELDGDTLVLRLRTRTKGPRARTSKGKGATHAGRRSKRERCRA